MPRFSHVVMASAVALSAFSTSPAKAQDHPFLGAWDCGVATFTFTETTYNHGSEDMTIQEIQEGSDGSWILMFADDYFITLSGFTGDEMGWMSSSGETLECTALE